MITPKSVKFIDVDAARTEIRVDCPDCKQEQKVIVPSVGYHVWVRGEQNIQVALPDVPKEQREVLITGICGECWKRMFPAPVSVREFIAAMPRQELETLAREIAQILYSADDDGVWDSEREWSTDELPLVADALGHCGIFSAIEDNDGNPVEGGK